MDYRREIDGLRAYAVLPVIFFHGGLPLFSGGFVGVDVFFVVSGYLITSIILADLRDGTFSLLGFFERRARRILPALFLVSFVSLPVAWLWIFPSDAKEYSQSLIAVSLFASNIFFWIQSGYFDTAGELKPLLHTWSLAVEEQYYLMFPAFLLLIWRFGKSRVTIILAMIAGLSFGLAEWGSIYKPAATYYLLPTRGWELLIGVLAAFHQFGDNHTCRTGTRRNPLTDECLSLGGLLLITYSVFSFDKDTPFPGRYALLPTLGTACVILFAHQGTFVGRLLGSKLLVGVGLVSYSAYLWHQPLFAFARLLGNGEPNPAEILALSAMALILAYASWHYVESPFRKAGRIGTRALVMSSILCTMGLISAGAYGSFKDGFLDRLTSDEKRIYALVQYDYSGVYRSGTCFLGKAQSYTDFSPECAPAANSPQTSIIWGDSHAAALSSGLRALIPGIAQYTASGCPPLVGMHVGSRGQCKEVNDFVLREVIRTRPASIYLHANWLLVKGPELAESLRNTLGAVRRVSPGTKIIVVGGVPQWVPNLPTVLLRKHLTAVEPQFVRTPLYKDLETLDLALRAAAESSGALFLSPLRELCGDTGCQVVTGFNGGFWLVAWDYAHLTEAGSLLLATRLLGR